MGEQLKTMYSIFARVPVEYGIQHIINQMSLYITNEGKRIVTNDENLKDPNKFTANLLLFKKKIDILIEKSFNKNMLFQRARDLAFQDFMNTCKLTPYYIVIYSDSQFKLNFKQKSLKEIESELNEIVRLFCCLHGRDIFIASYTELLASRLLNKTSVSDEAEKIMIRLL